MSVCPNCGQQNLAGDLYCDSCGYTLQPSYQQKQDESIRCQSCGAMNLPEAIYCESCGNHVGSAPVPMITAGPGVLVGPNKSEIRVATPQMTLGRKSFPSMISRSEEEMISRHHFTVTQTGGRFYIEDGGPDPNDPQLWKESLNGTKVNDVSLQPRRKEELKPNDTIDVAGVLRLKFELR